MVGDSPRDAVILQSEPKMKAALGKNVRVSLPKAYQTTKQKPFPTDNLMKYKMKNKPNVNIVEI